MAMKHYRLLVSTLLLATLVVGFAAAVGGDADDPLISLDFLTNTFSPSAGRAAQEKLDDAGKRAYDAAEIQWRAGIAAIEASAGAERAHDWTEARLKHGDVLSTLTGAQVMLLAGEASVQYDSGAVIDATDGVVLPNGGELKQRHRYLVAENTTALFAVVSRTAVLDYCGDYHFSLSGSSPDYNAMASALKTLRLFRGSGTGYGSGFDLELTPTRIQALVMLIRLLGEEDAALACADESGFGDVPVGSWFAPYVAYAVNKGYTNGVGGNLFAPNMPANAQMYVEFVLRALGYSSTAQTDITTASARALTAGVITNGEKAVLDSVAFLRADVVYLSWYALDVPVAQDMQPLYRKLEDMGVFTGAEYRTAKALVTSSRL